jgi:hypothetical protein
MVWRIRSIVTGAKTTAVADGDPIATSEAGTGVRPIHLIAYMTEIAVSTRSNA